MKTKAWQITTAIMLIGLMCISAMPIGKAIEIEYFTDEIGSGIELFDDFDNFIVDSDWSYSTNNQFTIKETTISGEGYLFLDENKYHLSVSGDSGEVYNILPDFDNQNSKNIITVNSKEYCSYSQLNNNEFKIRFSCDDDVNTLTYFQYRQKCVQTPSGNNYVYQYFEYYDNGIYDLLHSSSSAISYTSWEGTTYLYAPMSLKLVEKDTNINVVGGGESYYDMWFNGILIKEISIFSDDIRLLYFYGSDCDTLIYNLDYKMYVETNIQSIEASIENEKDGGYYQDETMTFAVEITTDSLEIPTQFTIDYKLKENSEIYGEVSSNRAISPIAYITLDARRSILGNETIMIWYDANDNDLREIEEPYAELTFLIIKAPPETDGFPSDMDVDIDDTEFYTNEPIVVKIRTLGWDIAENKTNLSIKGTIVGDGYAVNWLKTYTDEDGKAELIFIGKTPAEDLHIEIVEAGGITKYTDDFTILEYIESTDDGETTDNGDDTVIDKILSNQEIGGASPLVWFVGIAGVFSTVSWLGLTGKVKQFEKLGVIKQDWFRKHGMKIGTGIIAFALILYFVL